MFIFVHLMLVAAVLLLILVIAATASIPSRQAIGDDSPDGEWMGPARLPGGRLSYAPAPDRVAASPQVVTAATR